MIAFDQGITALYANRPALYHLPAAHNNTQQQSRRAQNGSMQSGRRDSVALTPLQKANKLITSLREQKQNVIKAKGELVAYARESGKDYKSIKPMMDSYNELLEKLDEQITGVMESLAQMEAAKLAEAKEKLEEKLNKSELNEPLTQEEAHAQQVGELTELASSINDLFDKSAISSRLQRMSTMKESEIEFDESLSTAVPAVVKRAELRDIGKLKRAYDNEIAQGLRGVHGKLEELQDPEELDERTKLPSEAELLEEAALAEEALENQPADESAEDEQRETA